MEWIKFSSLRLLKLFCFLLFVHFEGFAQELDSVTVRLDLSNQNIQTLPDSLWLMTGVTDLDVSGNPNLNVSGTFFKRKWKRINVSGTPYENDSNFYKKLKGEDLTLVFNNLNQVVASIFSNLQIVSFEFNDCIDLEPSMKFNHVKTVVLRGRNSVNFFAIFPNLEALTLVSKQLIDYPQISNTQLRKLVVSGSDIRLDSLIAFLPNVTDLMLVNQDSTLSFQAIYQLEELESLVVQKSAFNWLNLKANRLKKLKFIDCRGSKVSLDEERILRQRFPKIQIRTDPRARFLEPMVASYTLKSTIRKIKLATTKEVNFGSQVKFRFDSTSFLDENNDVVAGEIELHYRSFDTPLQSLFNGVPMTINKNDSLQYFKSLKMFEFRAYQQGKTLKINPDFPVKVEYTSNELEVFPVFRLDEKREMWVDVPLESPKEFDIVDDKGKPDTVNLDYPIRKPVVEELVLREALAKRPKFFIPTKRQKIYFFVTKSSEKGMRCYFAKHEKSTDNSWLQKIPELEVVNMLDWIIEDEIEYRKLLAVAARKTLNLIEIKHENDQFLIQIFDQGKTIEFNGTPDLKTSKKYNKKGLQSLINDLKKAKNQRMKEWETIGKREALYKENHQKAIQKFVQDSVQLILVNDSLKKNHKKAYEKKLKEWEKEKAEWDMKSYSSKLKSIQRNKMFSAVRSFSFSNMGLYNWDQLNPIGLIAGISMKKMIKNSRRKAKVESVFLCDRKEKSVIEIGSLRPRLPSTENKCLIVQLENKQLAYVSSRRFKRYQKKKKLKMKLFDPKEVTLQELEKKVFR